MTTLNLFQTLRRGSQYTFQFSLSGASAQFGFISDVAPSLRTLSTINQVTGRYNGGLWITTPSLYVTFTYVGSGGDTVNDIANQIMDTISGSVSGVDLSTISLQSATTNEDILNPDTKVGEQFKPFIPSQGTLILIVVGLALVTFLASGGAAVARRATA